MGKASSIVHAWMSEQNVNLFIFSSDFTLRMDFHPPSAFIMIFMVSSLGS